MRGRTFTLDVTLLFNYFYDPTDFLFLYHITATAAVFRDPLGCLPPSHTVFQYNHTLT